MILMLMCGVYPAACDCGVLIFSWINNQDTTGQTASQVTTANNLQSMLDHANTPTLDFDQTN